MIGLGWNKNLEQNTSSHGMLYVLKRLADVKRCVAVPSEWGLHKKVSRRTQQSICFNGYLAPVKANICTTTLQAQQIYLHNHNNIGTTNIFAQQQQRHNKYNCSTTIKAQQIYWHHNNIGTTNIFAQQNASTQQFTCLPGTRKRQYLQSLYICTSKKFAEYIFTQ